MSIISKLNDEIAERVKRIAEIQQQCSHPKAAVLKVNRASTGNYDPSDDCYWRVCECTLCQKKWMENQ